MPVGYTLIHLTYYVNIYTNNYYIFLYLYIFLINFIFSKKLIFELHFNNTQRSDPTDKIKKTISLKRITKFSSTLQNEFGWSDPNSAHIAHQK
mgnify:CR=1 FL=1